jgi:hypothetical protein
MLSNAIPDSFAFETIELSIASEMRSVCSCIDIPQLLLSFSVSSISNIITRDEFDGIGGRIVSPESI